VYYTGTDTLKEGYALCYNFNATDVSAENLTYSVVESTTETPARRIQVEKPSALNSFHFAGVVAQKFTDFTGPGYLEINLPGSTCNVWAGVDADHEGSGAMQSGQVIGFDGYTFSSESALGCGSAIVLQDVDRSTTNGLVFAELMTGPPSGGTQTLVSTDMTAGVAVSTGGVLLASLVSPVGITQMNVTDGTMTADVTFTQADGTYPGQTKVFRNVTAVDQELVVTFTTAVSGAARVVSLDAAGETAYAVWTGTAWNVDV
jgi:hypothetical protein